MNKFLMLGKEMTKDMVRVYEDCYFKYVQIESINDATFEAMGKKLYANKEMFLDYTKHQFEEDFNWEESDVNSFDFIQNLVGEFLCKEEGNHYWDEELEVYASKESLCYIVDSLNKKGYKDCFRMNFDDKDGVPVLTITLDEENNDNIKITNCCKSKLVVEHKNKSFKTGTIFDYSVIEDVKVGESFINSLSNLLAIYKRVADYRKLSVEELGLVVWEYMSDGEEYEYILEGENINKNTAFLNDIGTAVLNSLSVIKDIALYHEGNIDAVSDSVYNEMKRGIGASITNNVPGILWDNEIRQWVYVDLSSIEDFEKTISNRIEYFLREDNLELPGVLPRDIELKILRDYSSRFLTKLIESADERNFSESINEYLLEKVDEYYDTFLKEGSLKRLSNSDVENIYKKSLMDRFKDNIDTINKKIFMRYISSILLFRGFSCNDDYKIAVYSALLNHVSELEDSLDDLLKGGFSLSKIEDTIYYIHEEMVIYSERTGKDTRPNSGRAIAELIDSMFKDLLSKK